MSRGVRPLSLLPLAPLAAAAEATEPQASR